MQSNGKDENINKLYLKEIDLQNFKIDKQKRHQTNRNYFERLNLETLNNLDVSVNFNDPHQNENILTQSCTRNINRKSSSKQNSMFIDKTDSSKQFAQLLQKPNLLSQSSKMNEDFPEKIMQSESVSKI